MARIAFVDRTPDKDGITWAIYTCLDCAMMHKFTYLWEDNKIPYAIGK
jgi:hypothetical protein